MRTKKRPWMTNNTVAAETQALAMCRKDGESLYQVVVRRKDGSVWTSNTFPQRYAEEFAKTEIWNDRGRRFEMVTVEPARRELDYITTGE